MKMRLVPRQIFCAVMVAGVLGCGLDLAGEGLGATVDAGFEEPNAGQTSDGATPSAFGDDAGFGSSGGNADTGSSRDATVDAADARSSRGNDSSTPDGGSNDAADDGGGFCERLAACCMKLGTLGNTQSCLQSAQGGDAGTCQTALLTIQVAVPGLCP
jgi:hypothetical protein